MALVGGALSNQQRTHEAADLLVRGQIDWILRTVGHSLRAAETTPDTALMNETLDELRDEGVRYLALLGPEGAIILSAGTRSADLPSPTAPSHINNFMRPQVVRSRRTVQVTAKLPPLGLFRRYLRRGLGIERDGTPPFVAFEFEPRLANRLQQDVDRTFTVSIIATAFLSLMAGALWWQLRRRERQAETLEREQRLTQLGEMSAVLAHEIRNPLASLKGQAQLLVEQLPEGGRESRKAHRIVSEALRLEKLSGTLLDFVRSGSVERQPVDIVALVQRAADSSAPNRVHLSTLNEVERQVLLDPLRMQQVLENLFQNAVQASGDEMPIETTLTLTAHRLRISVRDHGPGLPPGEESKIFDAFQTSKSHGTGLGLAVARRIIELHEGTLTAQQHPDGGAVFTLEIPS
jgi:two-component system sensor histidine kinase HydH